MKLKINYKTLLVVICTILFPLLANANPEKRFTYHENDGVFIYYETEEKELYRQLLPKAFDMPDRLYVYSFISDFYKMDSRTTPYKEASIFLLAKHEGREAWHCIFMPVTSEISRRVGIKRLGLPKTMGDIEFTRSAPIYSGTATTESGRTMSLSVNTRDYTMSSEEENLIKELSTLPKLNLLNGEIIKMSGGRKRNLIDISKRIPEKLSLKAGVAKIELNATTSDNGSPHALDLAPSRVLGGYYLLNKIPFRLGKS